MADVNFTSVDTVRVTATFHNLDENGTVLSDQPLNNASDMIFTVTRPDGSIFDTLTLSDGVTNEGDGEYSATFTLNQAGRWYVRIVGVGPGPAFKQKGERVSFFAEGI